METRIPFVVYQTFKNDNLPESILNLIEHNKRICPKFDFKFYTDEQVDAYIKEKFDERTYQAYKTINPIIGAMKADFWRYCVLYKEGGVYLDIKSKINVDLATIIPSDATCILDIPRNNLELWRKNKPTFEQWLLIFAPGHEYLRKMIETMTERILSRYEPTLRRSLSTVMKQKVLKVTGPDALTKIIYSTPRCHIEIDYNTFASYSGATGMYELNKITHYSKLNVSLYV